MVPRSRFRGHINELVNLAQAELPIGSEAAGKYPQTAAALGALKEALRVEWGLDGQCVRRKRSYLEAKALKRVTSQLYWLRKTRPRRRDAKIQQGQKT